MEKAAGEGGGREQLISEDVSVAAKGQRIAEAKSRHCHCSGNEEMCSGWILTKTLLDN